MLWRGVIACSFYLVAGVASASADNRADAPRSLRMRPRPGPAAMQAPHERGGKQTAQAPVPDPPPADGNPAGAAGGPPEPAEPPPLPEPSAPPSPPANEPTRNPGDLSDAEFAKLAEQSYKEEVIVVTGSTIGRRTLTTPAPLTVLDREMLNAAGQATLADILQQVPSQQLGANGQQNTSDGSSRVDIRGLTSSRTLTLINGRRVVPSGSGADVSVDINTI